MPGAAAQGTPPPAGCVSDGLIDKVRYYYDANQNRAPGYGKNWKRVLIAFGDVQDSQLTPFTAAEARESEQRWSGWKPVREALECIEAANAQPDPTATPTPVGCVSDDVLDKVRYYYDVNQNKAPGYGKNWKRVLIAFGDVQDSQLTPFTAAEARESEQRWSGWKPVREALECIEAANAQPDPTPTATPVPPAPTPTPPPVPPTPTPTPPPVPTATPVPPTPTATPEPQPSPQQAEPQQAEPQQAEPQQSTAPTSYSAWVTQTPDQDYKTEFTYYVPEGNLMRFDVTAHVRLTPADASIDGVVVYLQIINPLLEAAATVGPGLGVENTHVPALATAWTHHGNGHYSRPVPVTFNTVDDAVVQNADELGKFEIQTEPTHYGQIRRGSGSKVKFIHQEDDRTYPTFGDVSYTSDTAGTFTVVSHREATGRVRVNIGTSGSAEFAGGRGGHFVDIPPNTPHGTEFTQSHRGDPLTFTCDGAGEGFLTLERHWSSEHQIEEDHSDKLQVCPRPAPPPPPPPPERVVMFSTIDSGGYPTLAGQTLHGDAIGGSMTGYLEVSGSASLREVSESLYKFTYVEHRDDHGQLATAFGTLDDGNNGVVQFTCGSGSGWVRVLYLMKEQGSTFVPYGPFRHWKVC